MSFSLHLLWVALAVEGGLIAIALGVLVGLRLHLSARARQVEEGVQALEPVLHRWLVGQAGALEVASVLRRQSPYVAFRSLARLAPGTLTFERQQALAPLLRREAWVMDLLAYGRSRLWWRRFDVARLLSIAGGDEDAPLIAAMLRDRHPAVRLVAIDAAARLGGRLIEVELDGLPARQDAVQAYQFAAMARHPGIVADALIRRLQPDAPVAALNAWIDAAGALASPRALDRVRDLSSHTKPEVRLHVARALRRHADPDTAPVLTKLLTDEDWRVRAQAARALGALRARAATPLLAQSVCDSSWWVRYRSALALAQIGGDARTALLAVAAGEDPMARDMARLVTGLSSAAVVEMSEV
jgi:HEAT repeat protein